MIIYHALRLDGEIEMILKEPHYLDFDVNIIVTEDNIDAYKKKLR